MLRLTPSLLASLPTEVLWLHTKAIASSSHARGTWSAAPSGSESVESLATTLEAFSSTAPTLQQKAGALSCLYMLDNAACHTIRNDRREERCINEMLRTVQTHGLTGHSDSRTQASLMWMLTELVYAFPEFVDDRLKEDFAEISAGWCHAADASGHWDGLCEEEAFRRIALLKRQEFMWLDDSNTDALRRISTHYIIDNVRVTATPDRTAVRWAAALYIALSDCYGSWDERRQASHIARLCMAAQTSHTLSPAFSALQQSLQMLESAVAVPA